MKHLGTTEAYGRIIDLYSTLNNDHTCEVSAEVRDEES